jgi:hypothetical protein
VIVDARRVLQPYRQARSAPASCKKTQGWRCPFFCCPRYGFQVLSAYGIQYLGQRLLLDLRMDLFRKVLGLSNDYFDRTPVGNTLTNLSNDSSVREFIPEGM